MNWRTSVAACALCFAIAGCGGSNGSPSMEGGSNPAFAGLNGAADAPVPGGGDIGRPVVPVGPGNGSPVDFTPVVQGTLASISVSPNPVSINVGATQQLTIVGSFSGGGTASVVASADTTVTFTAAGPEVTVSSTGLVSGVAVGTTSVAVAVTRAGQSFQAAVPVTVTAATGPVTPPVGPGVPTTIVRNGDFVTGDLSSWTQTVVAPGSFSGFPKFAVPTSSRFLPAQTGNPFFQLDVPGGASGYLEQAITIPAGVSVARLRYRVWGGLDQVNAYVSAGTLRDNFIPPPLERSAGVASGNTDETRTLDVTSLQGQTVSLRLGGSATGNNGTAANFDDVELLTAP